MIEVYTDGACKGNPGPGGWGAMLSSGPHEKRLFGGELDTTNNRMELLAAIRALEALKKPSELNLHTDSQYLRKGMLEWIKGWKKNGWKTAAKKPVKNDDLWKTLDALVAVHKVNWFWVKGHSGNPGNEVADQLANLGVDSVLRRDKIGEVHSYVNSPEGAADDLPPNELEGPLESKSISELISEVKQ